MKYIKATEDMTDEIRNIFHTTIKTVYSRYYPKEVVDFFCDYYTREHVEECISSGNMGVLIDDDKIIGTGAYKDNYITGVYILPGYRKKGYGTVIMDHLEETILKKYDSIILDSSLPGVFFYEKRGYKTIKHGVYDLVNDVKLVYEIMEKRK